MPPTPIDGTLELENYTARILSDADVTELFQAFLEERKATAFETLYQGQYGYYNADVSFSYTFIHDNATYVLGCPINETTTPKTLQLYYDKIYAAQADQTEALKQLLQDNNSDISFSVSVTSDSKLGRYANYYQEGISLNDSEEYQVLADYMQEGAVQAGETYASVSISPLPDSTAVDYEDWDAQSISILVPIDNAFFSDSRVSSYDIGNVASSY